MKTNNYQSLAFRLSLWIISSGTLITIIILTANFYLSRGLLEDYVEQLARKTVSATIQDIDTVLRSATISADSLAAVVSSPNITKDIIRQSTKAFVVSNDQIFGMAVALQPETLLDSAVEFSPYYYRNGDSIVYQNLANKTYQYQTRPWYTDTKTSGTAIWSEPYNDEGGGNVHMVTYSTPIFINNGKTFAGVATADIQLSWLDGIIENSKISDAAYVFIVSAKDLIVAHPDKALHMKNLKDSGITEKNWQRYLESKTTNIAAYFSTPCRYQKGDCWIAVKTLKRSGWKVIIVIPEDELISDIRQLTTIIAVIAAAGLLFSVFIIIFITRRLTYPLKQLALTTKDIGSGNLGIALPEPVRNDEIGALSNDFNNMRLSLKTYISDLKETSIKKQKLESEIQIATDIQMSMIPGSGNVFIEDSSFQLYAFLRPAKSVGGDLYYYQQSVDELHFIIGDVSDKGVPAALFMAKTVTLYTRALRDKLSPGQTLSMMNDILAQNNDACMFVTALCGIINTKTGNIVMSNAGHMNPITKTADKTHEQEVQGATALGLMEEVEYPDVKFNLSHDTSVVMYTDGISEAHNKSNQQYSDEKIISLIDNINVRNSEFLGKAIIKSVDDFAGDTEQFDDITLLIIRYE